MIQNESFGVPVVGLTLVSYGSELRPILDILLIPLVPMVSGCHSRHPHTERCTTGGWRGMLPLRPALQGDWPHGREVVESRESRRTNLPMTPHWAPSVNYSYPLLFWRYYAVPCSILFESGDWKHVAGAGGKNLVKDETKLQYFNMVDKPLCFISS